MLKVLAVLSVCLPLAMAQSGTAESGGQTIPGVTIRATQGERALSTITDEDGAFQFQGMMPGTWTVEADLFGFAHFKKDFEIAATPTKIDVALALQGKIQITQRAPGGGGGGRGGGNQQPDQPQLLAEVPAEAPQLPQSTANDSFTISGTVSTGLETNNNDFRGPQGGFPGGGDFGPGGFNNGNPGGNPGDFNGGNPGGQGGPDGGGGGRGGRNNNNGGNFNGGNFNGGGGGGRGGGGGNNGGGGGGRGGGGGNNGGGRGGRGGNQQARGLIGNRSKQGANQIRIQVFDTITNSAFNAKTYSINGNAVAKPQTMSNRYGLNIGGPMIIPHVFDLSKKLNFTITYNGTIQKSSRNPFSTLPTPDERSGNFAGISNLIYDPLSGGTSQFLNNQIPLTRQDPIARTLLDKYTFIPLPNQNTANNVNNFQFVSAQPNNTQNVNVTLNYTITPKDRAQFRVQTQSNDSKAAQNLGFIDSTNTLGQQEQVQETHNFTSRVFNQLSVSLNRNHTLGTPYFQTLGQDIAGQLGIAGTWPDPSIFGPPSLSFTSYTGLNDGTPTKTAVQTLATQESLSWRKGKHNLQFGGLYNRIDQNLLTANSGRGSFNFTGASTQQIVNGQHVARTTGDAFADFLLGLPQTASVTWGTDRYYRSLGYSLFANDDYRLSGRVSLSLGVRYEYTSPTSEKYDRLAGLQMAPGFSGVSVITPSSPGVSRTLVDPQRTAIEPRVGIAWQAMKRGSLLIRAGYGTYYNEGVYNQMSQSFGGAPQVVHASGQIQTSSNNILHLANGLNQIAPGKTILNGSAYDTDYRIPYTQSWNLGFQRNLPNQLVLQVTYNGIKGTHLQYGFDPNQALPGDPLTATQRLPIAYANPFTYNEAGANLISNSAQFQLNRRMRRNLAFQASYTRAKSIDDTVAVALNPQDIKAERALSTSDRRNAFQFQFTAESPVDQRNGFLANKGFLTKILKDWTLQVPITFQNGTPRTATVSGDIAGLGTTATQRAQATGLPITNGQGFFNPAAFIIPAAGTFGNAGRDTIPGPNSFTLNANMSRQIQFKERKSLEIQINSSNPLNHPVPSTFGTTVGALNYGILTNMGQMRQITATLRFRM